MDTSFLQICFFGALLVGIGAFAAYKADCQAEPGADRKTAERHTLL